MPVITHAPGAPVILAHPDADDFVYSILETPTGSPEGTFQRTSRDYSYTETLISGTINLFKVQAGPKQLTGPGTSLSSLTPSVVTINQRGETQFVSEGLARIQISSHYGQRVYEREVTVAGDSSTQAFGSVAPDSFAGHVTALIKQYYSGVPVTDARLQLSLNGISPNPQRVAPDIDMSWRSIQSPDGYSLQCSLVTPRHALAAQHGGFWVGRRYRFRRQDGTIQEVEAQSIQDLGGDLGLIYLSAPVTGCAFAKFSPDLLTKTSLLQAGGTGYEIPAIITLINTYSANLGENQKMTLCGLNGAGTFSRPSDPVLAQYYPPGEPMSANGVRTGDSGSAVFVPVIEQIGALPTCILMAACRGPTDGPAYNFRLPEISAALNSIAGVAPGTYSLQIADLARFPSYT